MSTKQQSTSGGGSPEVKETLSDCYCPFCGELLTTTTGIYGNYVATCKCQGYSLAVKGIRRKMSPFEASVGVVDNAEDSQPTGQNAEVRFSILARNPKTKGKGRNWQPVFSGKIEDYQTVLENPSKLPSFTKVARKITKWTSILICTTSPAHDVTWRRFFWLPILT